MYGSKYKDGAGGGCILINSKGTKLMISYRLEFEYMNNIAEYEALVQGLRKAIDLGAQVIEYYGDYEIIVKQVRDKIHSLSPHFVELSEIGQGHDKFFQVF